MNDTDNWSTDNGSSNIINNEYGPFSVDRFANNLNKKVNSSTQNIFIRGHPTLTYLQAIGEEIIIGFARRYRASVLC